jgi:transposase
MRDVELYRHLLGLETPWTVQSVELNVPGQRVDVWAGHAEDVRWPCPECGTPLGLYDHSEERVWRHLDSCQFMTYLHAQPPRVECPTHGVRQVRLPWAEVRARFTALFERLAIDVLKETDIRGATRILRISWDEAWHIVERAVERGQRAKPPRVTPHLGVDEKAIAKGHQYLTLVCDVDRRPSNSLRRTANRPAWRATSPAWRRRSSPASRRSPWTCGSPMSRPSAPMCRTRRPRWSSIAITS